MIMAGLEFMDEVPFKRVYFTSIIRDEQGRKLSKSLGNSPDPLDVIEEYGADALRYTVIYIAPVGQDLRYSNKKCEIGRNFANKLWNSARFRTMQGPLTKGWDTLDDLTAADLRPDDRWVLAAADKAVRDATNQLEAFNFNAYSNVLYEFVWNQFCDWFVESAKSAFYSDDDTRKQNTLRVYDAVMHRILRLMHPVMPFVTEELYHHLGYVGGDQTIMDAIWPEPMTDAQKERLGLGDAFIQSVENRFELIRGGRLLRGTYNIPSNQRIPYFIRPTDAAFGELLATDVDSLKTLLNAESVTIDPDYAPDGPTPSSVGHGAQIYLPLAGIVDVEAEMDRLNKQAETLEKGLKGLDAKLNNEKFVQNAKPEVVARERDRRVELREKYDQVQAVLKSLAEA
jgi:valyl-tRNA synthetase